MLAAATVDRIRTDAHQFDLARALLVLVLLPFVLAGWLVAKSWKLVELAAGYAAAAWKTGWHTARGDS